MISFLSIESHTHNTKHTPINENFKNQEHSMSGMMILCLEPRSQLNQCRSQVWLTGPDNHPSTWAPPRAKGFHSTRPWGRKAMSIILYCLGQMPSKSLVTSQYHLAHLLPHPRKEDKHIFLFLSRYIMSIIMKSFQGKVEPKYHL